MRRRLLRAAAQSLALTAIADCGRVDAPRDTYALEVAPLVEAVGARRPIEARLTGGFRYGEWRQLRGGGHDLQLDAAVAQFQLRGASGRAEAVAALIDGDVDGAIHRLDRLARSGGVAAVASDLAAARLTRWRRTGTALDAARALNDAGRAVALDPQIREAWFNRALALDAIGLSSLASDAWRRYTQLDAMGDWAREAVDRASRDTRSDAATIQAARGSSEGTAVLSADRVAQIPRIARQDLEDGLFGAWIDQRASDGSSERQLDWRACAALARSLARRGDLLWQSLVADLNAVPPAHRDRVVAALRSLIAARAYLDKNRVDSALPLLVGLAPRLHDVPSAQLLAEFWKQYALWYQSEKLATVAPLTQLRQQAAARHFAYLEARCSLMLAGSLESLARYDEAVSAFRSAIERFTRVEEVDFVASARAMLAPVLLMQGDPIHAWEEQQAALGSLPAMTSPRQRVVVLANGVLISARQELPFAALEIQTALIAEVQTWHDSGALARYYIERARLSNDVGMTTPANAAVAEGRRAIDAISDVSNRSIFDLDLQIETARIAMRTNPQDAARLLSNVIERMQQSGQFKLPEVYLDLGRARSRAGDVHGALQAWTAGIDVFEEQRRRITGEGLRISFYSRAWELYDSAISQEIAEGRIESALALAERSRARTLRDSLDPSGPVFEPRQLQSRLPSGMVLLTFASLRDSLLVWGIDRSRVTFAKLPYSADDVRDLVEVARKEIQEHGAGPTATRFAHDLYSSFSGQLGPANRLIVVPDGPLGGLPFAALPWASDGVLTVDRMTVSFSPSLSVFERASTRLTALSQQPVVTAVFVADPVIDRVVYPSLSRLPSARREVEDSARFYVRPQVFEGPQATGSVLRKTLGTADVVHFAGHAIGDPEFPLRAALVVAPEADRPGTILATDFGHVQPFGRTRLVILSACSTVNATSVFGEGALSLARPFLASGVPVVLGTLWDVDDGDAAALAPRFHRWLRAGFDPANALRRAQLELKTSPDSGLQRPRSWSGFVVIGGGDLTESGPASPLPQTKVRRHE